MPFSLNPPAKKVYIMHHKLMTVVNLLDIFCTTELSLISPNFRYIDEIKVHAI